MKYDPLYLFENKRNRFEKFLRRAMGKAGGGTPREEERPAKTKAAPVQAAAAMPRVTQSAQAARAKKPVAAAAAAAPDLISMAAVPEDSFGAFAEAPKTN